MGPEPLIPLRDLLPRAGEGTAPRCGSETTVSICRMPLPWWPLKPGGKWGLWAGVSWGWSQSPSSPCGTFSRLREKGHVPRCGRRTAVSTCRMRWRWWRMRPGGRWGLRGEGDGSDELRRLNAALREEPLIPLRDLLPRAGEGRTRAAASESIDRRAAAGRSRDAGSRPAPGRRRVSEALGRNLTRGIRVSVRGRAGRAGLLRGTCPRAGHVARVRRLAVRCRRGGRGGRPRRR